MKNNLLGDTGIFVSELCLGTMSFGGKGFWEAIGKLGQQNVDEVIKAALEGGINFLDTADAYSFGESETLVGQSLKNVGVRRRDVVLATKARIRMDKGINNVGLTRSHLLDSIDDSLKRLGTDYIDLYQIHGVDAVTPMEETLRALENIVQSGKVRYIGCCNLPAWQMMKALAISERHDWAKFVSVQSYYSLATRDMERECIPMMVDQKLGFLPWSPLAGGLLSGKFTRDNQTPDGARRSTFDFPPVDKEKVYNIVDVLIEIGKEKSVSAAQIALSWLLHQPSVTSVIIGVKTAAQLADNLKCVEVSLSADDLSRLDAVSGLTKEYPQWMVERQAQDRMPA